MSFRVVRSAEARWQADCTVSRALTGIEITIKASVADGLPDVDSGSLRSQLPGGA